MARPKTYTNKKLKAIALKVEAYTEKPPNGIPTVAECAVLLNHTRQFFYEHEDCDEFSDAVKKLMAKKEYLLEMGALSGKLNASMAIFSLKQMGWSDKREHSMPGGTEGKGPSKITIEWE